MRILGSLRAVLGAITGRYVTGATGTHHEVVAFDAVVRRAVGLDMAVTRNLAFDAAIRQAVATDVER